MAVNPQTEALYCQKCRTPVEVDASLDQLNPAAFKLLTDSTIPAQRHGSRLSSPRQSRPAYPSSRHQTYDSALQRARNPTFRRSVPPQRYSQNGPHNPSMSFVNVHLSESMLDPPPPVPSPSPGASRSEAQPTAGKTEGTDPQTARKDNISAATIASPSARMADGMETTNRMFEILSARSDIDHPICSECTELLIDGLQKRLTIAARERDAYVDYLRRANTDVPSDNEIQAAEAELEQAQKSEAAAIATLGKLEGEKAELDAQLLALEAESRELDKTENDFWTSRNAFATSLSSFQNERDALSAKHAHDLQVLSQLQRRSVYNDTFFISHDNYYATINGLRLGRLSNPSVDWPEINAAWGQTCLLLATLAERLNYKFQGYELCPMGSTSTILKLETKMGTSGSASQPAPASVTKQRLELYSTGDVTFHLGFMHRRFDSGMVAFLECLRQLGDFAERNASYNDNLKMPYEIKKDKINDTSIKLSLNKDENWTKACKYMLTCCKFLLAHLSNNIDAGASRRSR
ncbi:APG6-domain-containing protein [Sporormia fimetaria CBS 119925]|uniref:APG6-domain-containing protein n=1 Tax=Sporormia fimetaria CBS 119925 TaxID=1340428 RepID=A0A6A6VNH9_9PLEO|nr:APG6-domain-containing protein [Sporormia fimetaria CBS 119925]